MPQDLHALVIKFLVKIHEKKELLTLNKPIYVGCTVLELSKLEMYKYYYGFMKENVDIFELFYGDTDSFIYEITGQNFYEIMLKHKEHFDLSSFPKNSKYFCSNNKKVPAKMKDEYAGKIIYEGEFLKSKMYLLKTADGDEKSLIKDIINLLGTANMNIHEPIKKLLGII